MLILTFDFINSSFRLLISWQSFVNFLAIFKDTFFFSPESNYLLHYPWTAAFQAVLSMGFCRQKHWSWLPCPPQGDHPDPGIEHQVSCVSCIPANSLPTESPDAAAAAAAKSLQSYPTLCDPKDSIPLGSSVPGILQARTLEWVAISFSNA